MFFKNLDEKKAIYRLVKLAYRCTDYQTFERRIMDHGGWFLSRPEMKMWTKPQFKAFYEHRRTLLKTGIWKQWLQK